MAKGKISTTRPKNQKSIAAYMGGKKKKNEDEDSSSDVDATPAQKSKDASGLPPIHEVPAMFADLVGRIPEVKDVVERIDGRKLRVATMCSGTESPLLALDQIRRSIQDQYGVNLEVEHVFSCEIEPFKQAYIERNFQPPILFRDVCELDEGHATTAYGATVPVPGDVDLLVAGTSCVDYSNLNNEKQDIDANGESGRTFRGMMSWVKTHRPPIVILENVCGAPWGEIVKYFAKNGYSATHARLDTKTFYIPHTRTRGYLLAVNERNSSIPDKWADWVSRLKRPASSTLDEFLLPSDDPRIHQSREKLVRESYNALDRRTGRTDWGRCESRHQRARLEEQLGSKRPLTSWDEGGFCKMPDHVWNDWGIGQVERVWDLMDITLLRKAKEGIDPSYKTQVWNLSQNVDRNVGTGKEGICQCLTPSMIPYITNRGGPMVGLEALSMQGLPIDELLLTRETEDQLADLAGNAMSTTVVGACMLAALVASKKLLKAGDDGESYEKKAKTDSVTDPDAMDVDEPKTFNIPIEEHIAGEECLTERPLDLSATGQRSLSDLLGDAQKSVRLCQCEGRVGMTDRQLNCCKDCGWTSCEKCGGRPEHNYAPIDLEIDPRLSPTSFAKDLKSMLPMSLSLLNVDREMLDALKSRAEVSIPDKRWAGWRSAVLRAVDLDLRFVEPKRQDIWAAVYQSRWASLELLLHPQQPEWRLYAKPEDSEPASSDLRKILEMPIARFVCKGGLFEGCWEFALPYTTSVPISIRGLAELVPSWETRLGLLGSEFKDREVHSQIEITVADEHVRAFDRDISGTYVLLDKCGTASSALHKQISEETASVPPLFMLLDPARCGDPKEDCFVFSISTRRYEYGENRPIICRLDASWRQSNVEGDQNVSTYIPYKWMAADAVHFKPVLGRNASFATAESDLHISVASDACRSANALLVCRMPLGDRAGPEWPRGTWMEVDKVHERLTFRALAWLLERIRNAQDHFKSWQAVEMPPEHSNCERCAPTPPLVKWTKVNKKIIPIEDTVQAGEYERSLKKRPAAFVTQLKLGSDGIGTVRIGINVASLLHRAVSRLPSAGRKETPALSWRLDSDFLPIAKLQLPKFQLSSNRNDPSHAQPPNFKVNLRPEQLRSLGWMIRQESPDALPFIEEEIAEAILDPLGWRAEGRAQRPVHIRGGVLADEVGYGKTAITLGLIDCTSEDVKKEFRELPDIKGKIPVKATLVIVPPHLTRQWASEVQKFTGSRFKVVSIHTATNLNPLTIKDVQRADIVIIASNLVKSSVYLANLEALSGGGALPAADGRYFNARLQSILTSLHDQVELLKEGESAKVMEQIREGRRRDDEAQMLAPTKRLKGKSYRDAVDKAPVQKSSSPPTDSPAKRTPSGLVMEVVIPIPERKASSGSKSSSAVENMSDDPDSDAPPRRRRLSRKAAVIISDDEDEGGSGSDYKASDAEEEAPQRPKAGASVRSNAKRPKSTTSDESSASETASEDDIGATSDDDVKIRKSKAKSKVSAKGAKSRASSSDTDMTVDEPGDSKGKGKGKATKKRKSEDGDSRPAKKQKREDSDPWKLLTKAVQDDWTKMTAPPLEMFHFARKVVDEYTYLEGKIHALVTNITAERHWVLSGTPPLRDFAALKTIAAFLDLHLGVDDDNEGQTAQVKKRRREQTGAEKFHSFREVHSLEWHAHRHERGQAFLDQFIRQNIAEIEEIPATEKIEKIDLPAAERAIYLELEHHLRALDMTIKRGRKTESDREKRLAQALGESSTAEEALLKRCSHFELDTNDKENAMKACEVIVRERQRQLKDCKDELVKKLKEAVKMEKTIGRTGEESMFQEYVRVSRTEGVGDKEATEDVEKLLDEAAVPAPLKSVTNKLHDPKSSSATKGKGKGKADDSIPASTKDLIWEHREQTHVIRRLTKELVGRVRSLRYFTVVRDLQKQREMPPTISCPACEKENLPADEIAVLSSCGHTGCYDCVRESAEREECVAAAADGCKAAARVINVVRGDTLGVDDEDREGKGKHFGLKLEKVIHLIKKRLPKDDRILIFVQFQDLMKKVADALSANKVPFLEIKGSASMKSKNLEKFQENSAERVLLLNVMDESASGANLTSANHAIFLSPLLAQTQEQYDACETQAIGRVRRYGQRKHVYVWRFLTTNTIDMEVFEQRTGRRA